MKVFAISGGRILVNGDLLVIDEGEPIPKKYLAWLEKYRPELVKDAPDPEPLKAPENTMADTSGMKRK